MRWAARWLRGCWNGSVLECRAGLLSISGPQGRRNPRRSRLRVEELEGRWLPSTTPLLTLADASGTYNGNPFTASATIAGSNGIPGGSLEGVPVVLDYQQLDGNGNVQADLGSTPPLTAGSYRVTASFAGSADYDPASTTAGFTIYTPRGLI